MIHNNWLKAARVVRFARRLVQSVQGFIQTHNYEDAQSLREAYVILSILRIPHDLQATLILHKLRLYPQAYYPTRSIIENLIRLAWALEDETDIRVAESAHMEIAAKQLHLFQIKDYYYDDMSDEEKREIQQNEAEIKQMGSEAILDRNGQELLQPLFKIIDPNDRRALRQVGNKPDLRQKAEAVELLPTYDLAFRYASSKIHAGIPSITQYLMKDEADSHNTVYKVGRAPLDDTALVTACTCSLSAWHLYYIESDEPDSENLSTLRIQFEKLMGY